MTDQRIRIQKALADAGVASRRKADEMVGAGRVTVNGVVAGVGQLVDPGRDNITVDGRQVGKARQARLYLAMAKPAGVTSTVSDRHARRTVIDLVPVDLRRRAPRLYPVGRLDRESEGLLLLTNDGDWAQRMLHPSHGVEREYAVGLARPLESSQRETLLAGVDLEEGHARLADLRPATSADLRRLIGLIGRPAGAFDWYIATLRQGMKRQLRRMFASVGARVERLVRLRFGTLRLAGMALGDVREITATERRRLDALVDGRPGTERDLVVSIDGPGSSGKSTVGRLAAARLGYRFCDTGVLYRGLTWLALDRDIDPDDAQGLVKVVHELEFVADEVGRFVRLRVGGREVTDELHTAAVDRDVSRVSRHAEVRARLLPVQRALAEGGRIIMAGRDIGTVVLPDADPKIYLQVSVEERARRRAEERGVLADQEALEKIEDELRLRDKIDTTRAAAPLRVPDGAVVIDSEGNTLEQTVDEVVAVIHRREREAERR